MLRLLTTIPFPVALIRCLNLINWSINVQCPLQKLFFVLSLWKKIKWLTLVQFNDFVLNRFLHFTTSHRYVPQSYDQGLLEFLLLVFLLSINGWLINGNQLSTLTETFSVFKIWTLKLLTLCKDVHWNFMKENQ